MVLKKRYICNYAGVTNTAANMVAATLPEVSLMAWRTEWKAVEPKPPLNNVHTYRWTNLDAAVAAADAAGKKSTIRVMGGDFSPSWLQPQVTFLNQNGNQKTLPILWDSSYLDPFCELIAAVCQRYGNDARVAWIVMCGCGMNDEMVIGWSSPTNVWQSPLPPPNGCGASTYTPQAFVAGWNRCVDAYRNNLPREMRSSLCFDLVGQWTAKPGGNPMFVGNETDQIIAHCQTYGKKVIFQNNGLNADSTTTTTGKTYQSKVYNVIVANSSTTKVGWQMQHDTNTLTGMQSSLAVANESGATYVEVWPVDATNPLLAPAYQSFLAS